MSLIDDNGNPARLIQYLNDAVPAGPHPDPHTEYVQVRLDVVQTAADHIEWLEKGNEEWRQMFVATDQAYKAAAATQRIAVGHLQAVLNKARTHAEQQAADTAARDWLTSIGSEPT